MLFSRKNKKNIIILSSAESAQSVVLCFYFYLYIFKAAEPFAGSFWCNISSVILSSGLLPVTANVLAALTVSSFTDIRFSLPLENYQAISLQWCVSKHCWLSAMYYGTSMAQKSLGSRKFVLDIGSSSHWDSAIVPGQEASEDNLECLFYPLQIMVCWAYSLESPQ